MAAVMGVGRRGIEARLAKSALGFQGPQPLSPSSHCSVGCVVVLASGIELLGLCVQLARGECQGCRKLLLKVSSLFSLFFFGGGAIPSSAQGLPPVLHSDPSQPFIREAPYPLTEI